MSILFDCGFTFLSELDGKILMENKFTGLRLIVDEHTGKYKVIGD